jgi:tRNA (adenine-N(1)-)-methyltransferase non-catalytic subunit
VQLVCIHSSFTSLYVTPQFRNQRFGKVHCSIAAITGQPYGSIFEISKGGLRLLSGQDHLKHSEASSASLSAAAAEGADNRDLIDTNTSQRLTDDDIRVMRSDGASGSEIIKALVNNSESWHTKTQFSQQKWLARKEQK